MNYLNDLTTTAEHLQQLTRGRDRYIAELNEILRPLNLKAVPIRSARDTIHDDGFFRSAAPSQPYRCTVCPRRFSRPVHLGRHMQAAHPTVRRA